jgi:hypothetical protein
MTTTRDYLDEWHLAVAIDNCIFRLLISIYDLHKIRGRVEERFDGRRKHGESNVKHHGRSVAEASETIKSK